MKQQHIDLVDWRIEDGKLLLTLPPIHITIPIVKPMPPELTATERLTPGERNVFELLRRCKTNKEIATALNLSVHAIKFHVTGILRKLSCSSRGEVAYKFGKA